MFITPLRAARRTGRAVLAMALLTGTVAAVPAVSAGTAAAATTTATTSTSTTTTVPTRDPLRWPFARNSIWNTPIGSGAKYVPAGLKAANAASSDRVTADPEYISVNPQDPVRTLSVPGQAGHGAQVRVAPDLAHSGSWNGCSTLLTADGRSVWSGQPLRLSAGGSPTWTWTTQKTPSDLRGDGIEGCHGGSRMSGIGGSLRVGELNSADPLRHVLKVNLYGQKYLYRGTSQADSKRWPAFTADSYWASGYSGAVPALKMGALLALPPTADLSTITHPKVRKMAIAFRDYGGYVVDDTAWDVHAVDMDQRLVTSGEWPSGTDTAFHAQLQKVFQLVAVVDNNSSTSVGGGGTPRAPLAPCFADDTACITAEQALATPPTTTQKVSTVGATDTYVSALTPSSAVNGYGPLESNRSNGERAAGDGRTLTIGGLTFARGLGVHARSDVTYALDGKYAHFTTAVGVDDEVGARGSVVFEIWVDGVLKQRTARRTGSDGPLTLGQSVAGAKSMRLVVTDAGDGNANDHADWADTRLWVAK